MWNFIYPELTRSSRPIYNKHLSVSGICTTSTSANAATTMPPKQARGEYIETDMGNKVSRKSNVLGSQNIILGGKTIIQADCTVRGDLRRVNAPGQYGNVAIAVGQYCFFARSSTLKPPGKTNRGFSTLPPLFLPPSIPLKIWVGFV